MTVERDAASLVARSSYNHLAYIKPAAEKKPWLYAGKVESTVITMMMDMFGVTPRDIVSRSATFRACSGFNLMWRAFDEVVDEEMPTTDRVTDGDLLNTSVTHKYVPRKVTGGEGIKIALDSMYEAIPGRDKDSVRRRDRIEGLLDSYRVAVRDAANNPDYQMGEVLPYARALGTKTDVTGQLGRVGAGLCCVLLDLDDQDAVEMFAQASVAMQSGDDYLDWRKDIVDRQNKQAGTQKHIRPVENLLVATMEEHHEEKVLCEAILRDKSRRSALWLKELAPKTLDDFQQRFQNQMDRLPPHPYRDTLKAIVSLTFYKLLPLAPESGWFYRWAKY